MSPIHAQDLPPGLAKRLGIIQPKRQKFNARRTVVDGERFDSQREADYYGELLYRQKAGEIENIQRQPEYLITKDGIVLASFRPDFQFTVRATRTWEVHEVKGGKATRTEAYVLRKALVEAQHGIEIVEVQ